MARKPNKEKTIAEIKELIPKIPFENEEELQTFKKEIDEIINKMSFIDRDLINKVSAANKDTKDEIRKVLSSPLSVIEHTTVDRPLPYNRNVKDKSNGNDSTFETTVLKVSPKEQMAQLKKVVHEQESATTPNGNE